MNEIQRIKEDAEWEQRWDEINRKIAMVMDKDTDGILWENFREEGNGSMEHWLEMSIRFECYNLAKTINEQIELKNVKTNK